VHDLFQPSHLIFILLIVLILFGPGKLPELGRGLGRLHSSLRGEWSSLRGALFMAKGVDPEVGRDVGDMLPDEDAQRNKTWLRILLAILLGNTLYFLFSPFLPAAARFDWERTSALPPLVDTWFCLFMFGILNLAVVLDRRRNHKSTKGDHPPHHC